MYIYTYMYTYTYIRTRIQGLNGVAGYLLFAHRYYTYSYVGD